MRGLARHPGARGLMDDAAVLSIRGDLVLTHDMLVEGVHFLATDPAEGVAAKLLAVNLSDLAGKGVIPVGVLLGYALTGDAAWDGGFVRGLDQALRDMDVPLLGGDTVAYFEGPRVLSLTAIGTAPPGGAPSRSGAWAGNCVWVSGTIGDAGPGLAIARGERTGPDALLERYRRPVPRLALGQAIAGHVTAMMDVSDGLLIDLSRLAAASGVAAHIDLDAVPLSAEYRASEGGTRAARLAAVVAGDDYELLFTAPADAEAQLRARADAVGVRIACIGLVAGGAGLSLRDVAGAVPPPSRLGYEHGA